MPVKAKAKAGYHLDGVRVYHVKGKKKSRKKTYATKKAAFAALKKRGRRKH
ncbi:MAG: hypothetical protein WCX48_11015 [Bacteroidales bacterium]|jgi:hypothetical protein